tara:strand:- start:494 stop:1219 length:726 start_codon:yes stop_codon:yes gene_type:complete
MCLLISQTNNKPISKEKLQNANTSNPDGMGFAYSENGKITIKKFRNFTKFYKQYSKAVKTYGKTSDFILHFRYATSGVEKGVFNVHPFRVSEKLAFAHNGVLSVENHKKKSDTQVFNETILKKLPDGFLNNSGAVNLLEGFIGSDKLVFIENNGKSVILNEDAGHWDGGIWYSNTSYKTYTPLKYNCGWGDDYSTPLNSYSNTRGKCSWCQTWDYIEKTGHYGQTQYLCKDCRRYAKKTGV